MLVSGGGSNLQALLDASSAPDFPAQCVLVLSNVPTAFALTRAQQASIPTAVLPHGGYARREDYDAALVEILKAHQVELVCLAGFTRIITGTLLRAFPRGVLNIHPALLPAFPGMHGVRQAFLHGAKVAGCTVHFVDEGTDTGPILAQAAVPVLDTDTEETLAARILEQEHKLYPQALRTVAERRFTLEGRRVILT